MADYFPAVSRQLARLRCLEEFLKAVQEKRPLPDALCYVPSYEFFEIYPKDKTSLCTSSENGAQLNFRQGPNFNSPPAFDSAYKKKIYDLGTLLLCSRRLQLGISDGVDLQVESKETIWLEVAGLWHKNASKPKMFKKAVYLFWRSIAAASRPPSTIECTTRGEASADVRPLRARTIVHGNNQLGEAGGCRYIINRWEEVAEISFGVSLVSGALAKYIIPADTELSSAMRTAPSPEWDHKHDEALVRFLVETKKSAGDKGGRAGTVWAHVERIQLSSSVDHMDDAIAALTDDSPSTYWESDCNQPFHYIRLHMRKNTVIEQLYLTIDAADDCYLPRKICVLAADSKACVQTEMRKLSEIELDVDRSGDICIYEADETQAHPYAVIEIQIKECKDEGIDTRIRGLKIKTKEECDPGSELDFQIDEWRLNERPGLFVATTDPKAINWRAVALKRAASLLHSVLPLVTPKGQLLDIDAGCEETAADEDCIPFADIIKSARFLLPLTNKRQVTIDRLLKETESRKLESCPKLFINRHLSRDHRGAPEQSVFNQVHGGLKLVAHQQGIRLNYRWSPRYEQWWECKFIGEGVIDQGGGFRDSLCDIGEELCPTDPDASTSLPYFLRAPNQQEDEHSRDTFVVNPGCREFGEYEWIGQLIGACVRTREHLVLPFTKFTWKQILGQPVSWTEDFTSVDRSLVRIVEKVGNMSREEFDKYFGHNDDTHAPTMTATLCDSTVVELVPGGSSLPLLYEDRKQYADLIKHCRLMEGFEQVNAIRNGLLRVVPEAALQLLTWYELEHVVCGDPEVSLDALKKAARFEELDGTERRVQHLWEALSNFSNDERSKFLRFVTGRRRLPTPLYICTDKRRYIYCIQSTIAGEVISTSKVSTCQSDSGLMSDTFTKPCGSIEDGHLPTFCTWIELGAECQTSMCPNTRQSENGCTFLPETSTCSNTLFLPDYPSAAVCEEKLRYAIDNCLAIDTDMSPWEM